MSRPEPVSPGRREAVTTFLNHEAELLDNRELKAWLDLLTEDITYEVPRRVTREVGEDVEQFSKKSFHLQEDRDSLEARITRYDKDYAWAENPASRTTRLVSNIRIEPDEPPFGVKSNFLLVRLRNEEAHPTLLSGERHDTLRREDGKLMLADRRVLLAQTVMPTQNLSEFL